MSRWLLPGLLLGALIALAIGVGLALKRVERTGRFVLTNGQEVRVLGLLPSGTSYDSDQGWRAPARRVLPAGLATLLPTRQTGHCSSGTNSATLYLQLDGLPPGNPLPWSNYRAEDDLGFSYPMEGGYCSFGGGAGGVGLVFGFTLRTFPRRQPEFWMRFRDANGVEVGAVRVKNPYPGPFPEWTADPLPITRTNGPVALTLLACEVAGQPAWRYLKPQWRVVATDPRWAGARAGFATVADATGNQGSLLSTNEPVWRVNTAVHRERWENFLPEEIARFDGLAVPARGGSVVIGQTQHLAGATLRLRAVADSGRLYFTNDVFGVLVPGSQGQRGHGSSTDGSTRVEYWGSDRPWLLLETHGIGWDDKILFRLRDQAGREIKLYDNQGRDGLAGGGQMHLREFDYPTNATGLSLEVVVSRPLDFEFFISPAQVKPAPPP